ncbi:MAG: response regulator [Burkholderiaceae bacterium]|nr:response regulator [Burkholderiaceae bacterium]
MTHSAHVLIVEDDEKIAALLQDYFHASGFRTTLLADGKLAVDFLRKTTVDLILLDLMLPGMDGIAVCEAVRGFSSVPIIMLTARVEEVDRLLGLETGADDYVCKPFSPREVVARAKAQLRRAGGLLTADRKTAAIQVERQDLRISLQGVVLPLTPVEFRLLAEMTEHPERVYTRQQLLDLCHDDQRDINDRTIDTHIKNIRRKMGTVSQFADSLKSVYGVGYRFEYPSGET